MGDESQEPAGAAAIDTLLRGGELRVVFQPIIELASMKVVGYEALARFPDAGSRSPAAWFQEATASGQRVRLESEAIRVAVASSKVLPEDAFIAFNASPETAASSALRHALGSMPLSRVMLDISEAAAVEEYGALEATIDELRAEGVRIAIDDASGDSLNNIIGVRPDIIKIDTDITRGIDGDIGNQAVALALGSFSDRIGATVIAEGIETETELETLRSFGIHAGQGYHIGRPQPAEAYAAG